MDLVRRIRSEYLAIPGLRLTFPQAKRLWSADAGSCATALAALVDSGFLARADDRTYVRRYLPGGASHREVVEARQPPFDCRWAEPVLSVPGPLWLDASERWTCLRDDGPEALDVHRCLGCPRWEPRLGTRGHRRRSLHRA